MDSHRSPVPADPPGRAALAPVSEARRPVRSASPWAALLIAAAVVPAGAQEPTATVQPGAPGEPTRVLDRSELSSAELPTYTAADVRFMRGMIPHHAQALEMAALVEGRTENEDLRHLARRIEISQRDEIALMERWLEVRGEAPPEADGPHPGHRGPDDRPIPGMLSSAEMEELATARGTEFERRFLEAMIRHHEGALAMVEALFGTPGAGQTPAVHQFASEVEADQEMEIRRMQTMLERR